VVTLISQLAVWRCPQKCKKGVSEMRKQAGQVSRSEELLSVWRSGSSELFRTFITE
jgi:hypothetical protein